MSIWKKLMFLSLLFGPVIAWSIAAGLYIPILIVGTAVSILVGLFGTIIWVMDELS